MEMVSEEKMLLEKRKAGFEEFYRALIPSLVEFVGKMGISPAHEVLKHAVQFAPNLDHALKNMAIADDQDRSWLILRMGYFIGEYFAQKHGGGWYVNEIQGSRYFARYVVGQFSRLGSAALMIDPFQIAQSYVDSPVPRRLEELLAEVDAELANGSK
jgi:hypothetical protein